MKWEKFSRLEVEHLTISVLVMSLVVGWEGFNLFTVYMLPVSLVLIAPAFVLHEMGHKFAAQKYGFRAEYRMWVQGLLLAFIMRLLVGFVFLAPGAVYFSGGHGNRKEIGKIGFAGPLVNLMLAVVFGLAGLLAPGYVTVGFRGAYLNVGLFGAYLNSLFAMFNLLPIPPLDGMKILAWDKRYWVLGFACAIAALFISGRYVFLA